VLAYHSNVALHRQDPTYLPYVLQGWLSKPIENSGHKQAAWRGDPAQSGKGGAIGDIGTHAFHLLEYISGLEVTEMNATLRSVVEGRRLDDDCNGSTDDGDNLCGSAKLCYKGQCVSPCSAAQNPAQLAKFA